MIFFRALIALLLCIGFAYKFFKFGHDPAFGLIAIVLGLMFLGNLWVGAQKW